MVTLYWQALYLTLKHWVRIHSVLHALASPAEMWPFGHICLGWNLSQSGSAQMWYKCLGTSSAATRFVLPHHSSRILSCTPLWGVEGSRRVSLLHAYSPSQGKGYLVSDIDSFLGPFLAVLLLNGSFLSLWGSAYGFSGFSPLSQHLSEREPLSFFSSLNEHQTILVMSIEATF